MQLTVHVEGSGPMAPMWEAMGGPLLPRFALAFAERLRDGIESTVGMRPAAAAERPAGRGFFAWLRRLVRSLFGGGAT
jgi:hypothetical protein